MGPFGQLVVDFKKTLSLIYKRELMSQVISLAQLTRKIHLLLIFLNPISIICGFRIVLVSLTFLPLLLLPTGMLIALLRGLCKNICILG